MGTSKKLPSSGLSAKVIRGFFYYTHKSFAIPLILNQLLQLLCVANPTLLISRGFRRTRYVALSYLRMIRVKMKGYFQYKSRFGFIGDDLNAISSAFFPIVRELTPIKKVARLSRFFFNRLFFVLHLGMSPHLHAF